MSTTISLLLRFERYGVDTRKRSLFIKLSSVVSDLLGTSARRMLKALADGETDPATLAALADSRLRATPDQLRNAFDAARIFIRCIGDHAHAR